MFDAFFPTSDATDVRGQQACGLFDESHEPVPLRSRTVEAQVFAEHGFANYTETLSYESQVDCTATFTFPLPPRAAVYK